MILDELPSTGTIPSSHKLVFQVAKAIDYARMMYDVTSGDTDTPEKLREFFLAAAAACPTKPKEKKK